MKKTISISTLLFTCVLFSCQKNSENLDQASIAAANSTSKTICVLERPKAQQDCGEKYAPVCGCNSVTYSSACVAQNEGVARWVNGTCEDYGGGYPGDGINR